MSLNAFCDNIRNLTDDNQVQVKAIKPTGWNKPVKALTIPKKTMENLLRLEGDRNEHTGEMDLNEFAN